MSQLVTLLLALPPALVLAAAALLPALEASTFLGVVIPGESAVFVGEWWPVSVNCRCGR